MREGQTETDVQPDVRVSPADADVVFLLTDIVGSTELWEKDPTSMGESLARHDALIRAAVEARGGTFLQSKGEGDSTFSVFSSEAAAAAAAADIQLGLQRAPWPATIGKLTVRVGLNVGTGMGDGDYYGSPVNLCARLRGVAHGGQILLSESLAQTLRRDLPEGMDLKDLGRQVLKGFSRPERVFQLCHPELPVDFPPLSTGQSRLHGFPSERTSFVGRTRDVASLQRALEEHRAVAIVGVGGVGKTRLAGRVARASAVRFDDGAYFVDLASVTRGASFILAVAAALDVEGGGTGSLTDEVLDAIGNKKMLIVLDNSEHVLEEAEHFIDQVLDRCDNARLLVTSRRTLKVYGIFAWPVEPLTVTAGGEDAASTSPTEAVQLFLDRLRLSRPSESKVPGDLSLVQDICRFTDGLPLAIEIAAARAHSMSLAGLRNSLEGRARLLHASHHTRVVRQMTLGNLLDWSYELLEPVEQEVLRRISVFEGSFDAAAADAVVSRFIQDVDTAAVLDELVDQSLLVRKLDERFPYRLLQTVRQYGRAALVEASEMEETAQAHRHYLLGVASSFERDRRGRERLDHARAIIDDFRAAFEWSVRMGNAEEALTLALGINKSEVPSQERKLRFQEALAMSGSSAASRSLVLTQLCFVETEVGNFEAAQDVGEEALRLARTQDDPVIVMEALNSLSGLYNHVDDAEMSLQRAEEQLQVAEAHGDGWYLALAHTSMGVVFEVMGELEAAWKHHSAAQQGYRMASDALGEAVSLVNLADVKFGLGDIDAAVSDLEQADEIFGILGVQRGYFYARSGLAALAAREGRWSDVRRDVRDLVDLCIDQKWKPKLAGLMAVVAAYAFEADDYASALSLVIGAEERGLAWGNTPWTHEQKHPDAIRHEAGDAMSSKDADKAIERGRTLSDQDVAALIDRILRTLETGDA